MEELVQTKTDITQINNFSDIISYRNELLREKTSPIYIRVKDKFPYLPSKYVDDVFNKWFPINSVDMIDRKEDEYYITYTVKITVAFPNGLIMSKIGTGSARKQVKKDAKERVESGKGNITPFDYVDNGNASKAALTLAIKNCQERFGIGADITERLILTEEEIKELNDTINKVVDTISNPRDKIKWKEAISNADSPNKRMKILEQLRELFDVDDIILEREVK